jgi:hypothetical protein
MNLTANKLRAEEDAIFDALECQPGDATFRDRLYRDGVPTPKVYLAQPQRVLFVFREPNMGGVPYAHDMRDEVNDIRFRPLGPDGARIDVSPKSWWNAKAGMFAHAAGAALDKEPASRAFRRFSSGGWNHAVVNRSGYIQVKKIGGGGSSNAAEIRAHAKRYTDVLREQIAMYQPHLILGCGVGEDSPARLLAEYVLRNGEARTTNKTGATWWKFPTSTWPRGMVQLWHPAWRGDRWRLYEDVWASVHEVAKRLNFGDGSSPDGLRK